jgi:RNA methyltransferase, TrmH family
MKPTIQSPQNQQIKLVVKLRDASARRETGYFIIDGAQEISRAIAEGFQIDCLYFPGEDTPQLASFIDRLESEQLQPVSPAVMRKLAYGDRETGLVAVAKTPSLLIAELQFSSQRPLVLVLDRIEKPGNLGACLRTAAATGADAVILTNPICDVFNPNAIRASRGCLFSVPIAVASSAEVFKLCSQLKIPVYTARVDGVQDFWQADFSGGAAIVLGNEATGLQGDWASERCNSIVIPMRDDTDSLNVSISTAVTLYEAVRQRRT